VLVQLTGALAGTSSQVAWMCPAVTLDAGTALITKWAPGGILAELTVQVMPITLLPPPSAVITDWSFGPV
jgi:hypothetical protein